MNIVIIIKPLLWAVMVQKKEVKEANRMGGKFPFFSVWVHFRVFIKSEEKKILYMGKMIVIKIFFIISDSLCYGYEIEIVEEIIQT